MPLNLARSALVAATQACTALRFQRAREPEPQSVQSSARGSSSDQGRGSLWHPTRFMNPYSTSCPALQAWQCSGMPLASWHARIETKFRNRGTGQIHTRKGIFSKPSVHVGGSRLPLSAIFEEGTPHTVRFPAFRYCDTNVPRCSPRRYSSTAGPFCADRRSHLSGCLPVLHLPATKPTCK